MKKLLQIIAAAVLGAGLMAGVAAADSVTCGNITNTGPGSTNTVTCVDDNQKNVTCTNNEIVENSNDQDANSGNTFTTGNTSSGDSNSGDSSNSNTVTVDLGASCEVVATATTPAAPVTPGGQGGGTPAVAATPAPAAQVASLPETGSNSFQNAAVRGVVILGGAAAVAQLAVIAYRRFALK